MRYSQTFGKTKKVTKEFDSTNATLLIKAGFIDQTMAGVYTYLPLGLRVLTKIENIVREEMDKISAEILMPGLSPKEWWELTDRLNTIDVQFKVVGANKESVKKNDTEYVLNASHEEVVTPLAKKFNVSYKDLPFSVYQIQTKFRNEARPKSGLLRGREFRMKDMYSFHKNAEELKGYYQKAKEAYERVYARVGIGKDTYFAAASGGIFTEGYSHEFQTRCETGEDLIFYVPSTKEAFNKEIAPAKAPTTSVKEPMRELKAVFGEGIVGVDDLCNFLKITPDTTTKTLIYTTDRDTIIAVVRGDYDVNEEKLRKVAKVTHLELASQETVQKLTGAKIGYAGIYNLPKDVRVFMDDAIELLVNFETGANKTNYHITNMNWERDVARPDNYYDIKMAKEGDIYPATGEGYETFKASEVGNIFPLYDKYTKAFDYYFNDKDGSQKIVQMGCYGLGTSRVMGVVVEKFHDDKGIVWPESIAPFKVHMIGMNLDDALVNEKASAIYKQLLAQNIEVLFDDRIETTAGEKFADADLIGIPYRVIISKKTGDKVEVKKRAEKAVTVMSVEELIKIVK
jgi:prolyl-tRNA synthetase